MLVKILDFIFLFFLILFLLYFTFNIRITKCNSDIKSNFLEHCRYYKYKNKCIYCCEYTHKLLHICLQIMMESNFKVALSEMFKYSTSTSAPCSICSADQITCSSLHNSQVFELYQTFLTMKRGLEGMHLELFLYWYVVDLT